MRFPCPVSGAGRGAARVLGAPAGWVLNLFMQGIPAAEIKPSSELLFDALMAKLLRPK